MATELLDPQELAEIGPPEAVRLPLDLVDPNPHNPRRHLAEVDALADNIRAFGLLQPVTVRRAGERYELLGGHRRRAAWLVLREREPHDVQWRTIPAVVRAADTDDQDYLRLISSQVHNRNWAPREEASALERLAISGLTLEQIGQRLNRGISWASKRLRVYADSVLSGFVQSGRLSTAVAEELLLVPDVPTRRGFAEQAVEEGWSASHARAEVRKLKVDKQLREVARRARELLEILGSIDAARLPASATKDLWTLQRRIVSLGRGGPVMPSLEEAERAAGVNPERLTRRQRARRLTIPH